MLKTLWNGGIIVLGASLGAPLRVAVDRGWIHFPFLSDLLARLPFSFGWKLRRAVYSHLLTRIGRDAVLYPGVILEDPRTTIGDDVWLSAGCYVDYALIGDHVLIGQQTVLLAGRHHHRMDRLDIPIKQQGNPPKEPIRIGSGCWVGANCTIMADIGKGAVVGAGSVVTKAVSPLAVVAGNPARLIRMRTSAADEGPTIAEAGEPFAAR